MTAALRSVYVIRSEAGPVKAGLANLADQINGVAKQLHDFTQALIAQKD